MKECSKRMMKKKHRLLLGLIAYLAFATSSSYAADYYWVGGGGEWSDLNHWATSSGGSNRYNVVPTADDNVFFDKNSGFESPDNKVVDLKGSLYCKNLIFEDCVSPPTINLSGTIQINGSLTLQDGMGVQASGSPQFLFTSNKEEAIQTNGLTDIPVVFHFTGNGVWTFGQDLFLKKVATTFLHIESGKVILEDVNVYAGEIKVSGTGGISIKNSRLDIKKWTYSSSVPVSAAETEGSHILLSTTGKVEIDRAYFQTTYPSDAYGSILAKGTMRVEINQGTFKQIDYEDANGDLATKGSITVDELFLRSTGKYQISNTITVNSKLQMEPGTCGGLIDLVGKNSTSQSLNVGNSEVLARNVRATYIDITGSKPVYDVTNGWDGGNSSGWNFLPANENTYYWVGGAGDWNDPIHWASTSGGIGGSGCIPSPADHAIFDDNSGFTSAEEIVALDMAAYCNDLLFQGTTNPPIFDIHYPIEIHGSFLCQQNMKLYSNPNSSAEAIWMMSDDLAEEKTIRLNGTVLRGGLYFSSPSGKGKWRFEDRVEIRASYYSPADSYVNAKGSIIFQSGHLNFNGQEVVSYSFQSHGDKAPNQPSRSLNLANATVRLQSTTYTYGWDYRGGQPLTAEQTRGSHLYINTDMGGVMAKEGDVYYNVTFHGDHASNAVDKGTYNKIEFASATGAIKPGVITDSLVFTSSGTVCLHSDVQVNRYLGMEKCCGGGVKLHSNKAGTQYTIAMGSSSEVSVSHMMIGDVIITGPNVPYEATASIDLGNNVGWLFTDATSVDYYWIGGEGNWEDPQNWSLTSGGTANIAGCIPSSFDNVFFDDNSFSAPNQQVIVGETAYCNDMKWIGSESLAPVLQMVDFPLNISGSLEFQKGMLVSCKNLGGRAEFVFISDKPGETITSNGVKNPLRISFEGTGGWQFQDAFSSGMVTFSDGHLDFNGQLVKMEAFDSKEGNDTRSLNIANSVIEVLGAVKSGAGYPAWKYTGGVPLTEEKSINSTIIVPAIGAGGTSCVYGKTGDIYHNVEIYRKGATVSGATFNKVYLDVEATIDEITTDTLQFKPGPTTYLFTAGKTSYIKEAWYGSGNNCGNTTIRSTQNGVKASVNVAVAAANVYDDLGVITDTLQLDFTYLRDMHTQIGDGLAILKKGSRSPDTGGWGASGNNENWTMAGYVEAEEFKALGENLALPCDIYPYTIRTTQMVPTPQSTFKWRKGSEDSAVISTDREFVINDITELGTYFCTISYGDGCELTGSKTLVAGGDSLIWTGAVSADWNHYENWKDVNGEVNISTVPDLCTNVLIPAGVDIYPNLDEAETLYNEDRPTAACNRITFEHGAEVLRTDSLHYYQAVVQLGLNSNQWYMLSAPLKNTYSGDIYVNDRNPIADGYFIYPMLFNQENPETGYAASYTWTQSFNTPDVELKAGQGFALWADNGKDYDNHNPADFWFPKNDPYHSYYTGSGVEYDRTPLLDRSQNGRFIYEGEMDSDGNVDLHASPCNTADEYVLVGNPFMAHLDFAAFAERNKSLIANEFKLAYGIAGEAGKVNDFVAYKLVGGTYVSTGMDEMNLIAPMQSFLVKSTQAATPALKANIKEVSAGAGVKLRGSLVNEPLAKLEVVAEHAGLSSLKALLIYHEDGSNTYASDEDSYKLFSKSAQRSVLLYTRSSDGYALDINTIGQLDETIGLGLRTSATGEITLRFSGVEQYPANIRVSLYDALLDQSIDLTEVDAYTFVKDDSSLYLEDRFRIVFTERQTTGIESHQQADASVVLINSGTRELQVRTTNGESISSIAIFDLQGQNILTEVGLQSNTHTVQLPVEGIYVVKVQSEKIYLTKKVQIR